ncbi:MAG: BACON domain-containing carbohydrate-binding protein [Acidobacteriota bacterium]
MKNRPYLTQRSLISILATISVVCGIGIINWWQLSAGAQENKQIAIRRPEPRGQQGRNPHSSTASKSNDESTAPPITRRFANSAESNAGAISEAAEPDQTSWRPTNGPTGGNVTCLAVSGSSIFAGTSRGGVFVSTDQGANWRSTGVGVITPYISSLLVSGGNVFVGADGERVYRSSDRGNTWKLINNGLSVPNAYGYISALGAQGTTLYAGSVFGWIFVSTDQGESWTPLNTGLTPQRDIFFAPATCFASIGDQLFVSTNGGGVYRLDNNARRWLPVSVGLPDKQVNSLFAVGSKLVAGMANYYNGIYVSTDQGQSWRPAASSPQDVVSAFVMVGSDIYGAAYQSVLRSHDQGETWQEMKTGFPSSLAGDCIAVGGNSLFVGSSFDGVYRSDDGGEHWALSNNGLAATDTQSLVASGNNLYAGAAEGGGVQVTSDNGQTWRSLNNGLPAQSFGGDTRRIAVHGSVLIVSTSYDGVFRSSDQGQSWQSVGEGLPPTQDGKAWPASSYLSRGSNLYATLYNRGVYVSINNGSTWTALNNGLTDLRCRTMVANGSSLFVGAGDFSNGSLFRSDDGGQNWVEVKTGLPAGSVSALAVSNSTVLAGTSRGVYLSTNNGETWSASTNGINTSSIEAFAVSGQFILAGNDFGVFLSSNQGQSWANISAGLSDQFIRSLAVTDRFAFVGTQDRGVFVRDLATIQCSYSLSPTNRSIGGAGGNGTVAVTATNGCAWQAVSIADWITVTSGANGTGNGTVGYSVAANTTQTPRSGTVTIAGQAFVITQSGCATISATSQSFTAAGGNGSVAVTSASGCSWTAASGADWLTITAGASGAGNGTVSFTVAANTLLNARTSNLTIAGQSYIVTQSGNCVVTPITAGRIVSGTLSATDCPSLSRGASNYADRYSFTATAGQAVAIELGSGVFDTYLALIGPNGNILAQDDDSGVGTNSRIPATGFFQITESGIYTIEATSLNGRTTGDYTLLLLLGSTGCTYQVSTNATPVAAAGGTRSYSIATGANCLWQAVSTVPWAVVTSGADGTGNGTANLTVAPNGDKAPRTATLLIAGLTVTVSQLGNAGACPSTTIANGQTINGSLEASDCYSAVRAVAAFADRYTFSGTAGQKVGIGLTASAYDAFLVLLGPDGQQLAQDDDGGGGTNSRIPSGNGFFALQATGVYTIEATSLSAGRTGAYSVTLDVVAANCSFAITPRTQIAGYAPTAGSVSVMATAGCAWRAASETSWITVSANTTGSGNGIVSFTIAANPSAASRSGQLRIAGELLNVSQLGVNPLASVSAASFGSAGLSVDSMAAAFGTGLATTTQAASVTPLPVELAGTRVNVKDSLGVERVAQLFFASPGQVNFLVPLGLANGQAMVTVTSSDGRISTGAATIATVAPGLFSANSNGQDVALGVVLRVKADGSQIYEPIARFDAALNRFVPVPIDFGALTDQIYLVLFGTGFRNRTALTAVTANLGGVGAQVVYAGSQGDLAGLDQLNLLLPRSMAGRGEVDVTLTVSGAAANVVKVSFK